MNSRMAAVVLVYGIGMIIHALLVWRFASGQSSAALIAGLVGGGLSGLWGVLGLLGMRRRVGAVLTLIPICIALIIEAVRSWAGGGRDPLPGALVPALITIMALASVGVLTYVFHGGEHAPSSANRGRNATH